MARPEAKSKKTSGFSTLLLCKLFAFCAPCWSPLGSCWSLLASSWRHLGSILGLLGAPRGRLGDLAIPTNDTAPGRSRGRCRFKRVTGVEPATFSLEDRPVGRQIRLSAQESGRDRSNCRIVSAHSFTRVASVIGGADRTRTARPDQSRDGLGCTLDGHLGIADHGAEQTPP